MIAPLKKLRGNWRCDTCFLYACSMLRCFHAFFKLSLFSAGFEASKHTIQAFSQCAWLGRALAALYSGRFTHRGMSWGFGFGLGFGTALPLPTCTATLPSAPTCTSVSLSGATSMRSTDAMLIAPVIPAAMKFGVIKTVTFESSSSDSASGIGSSTFKRGGLLQRRWPPSEEGLLQRRASFRGGLSGSMFKEVCICDATSFSSRMPRIQHGRCVSSPKISRIVRLNCGISIATMSL